MIKFGVDPICLFKIIATSIFSSLAWKCLIDPLLGFGDIWPMNGEQYKLWLQKASAFEETHNTTHWSTWYLIPFWRNYCFNNNSRCWLPPCWILSEAVVRTKFGSLIWVARQSLRVVKRLPIDIPTGRKCCYHKYQDSLISHERLNGKQAYTVSQKRDRFN